MKASKFETLPYENSTMRSRNRRRADRKARKRERRLGYAAVLGAILLVWWITLSSPVEVWYLGLLGIVAVVPYLTLRLERMFDAS